MTFTKKFYCPVNGWDCPYWKKDGSCKMVDEGLDPTDECDDAAAIWDDDKDPFMWVDEAGIEYDAAELLEKGFHFINGVPVLPPQMSMTTVARVQHIFQSRIDHAKDPAAITAWTSARDIFNLAIDGRDDVLKEWDYLLTKKDCEKMRERG